MKELCEFRKGQSQPYVWAPITDFDSSSQGSAIDACQQGNCLTRGHAFKALQPVLEDTLTEQLSDDSGWFADQNRINIAEALSNQPETLIPLEAISYLDMSMQAENLKQIRLLRTSQVQFQNRIHAQSVFDGSVGLLFLVWMVYRLATCFWKWFSQLCNTKKQDRAACREKKRAERMVDSLCDVINQRRLDEAQRDHSLQ